MYIIFSINKTICLLKLQQNLQINNFFKKTNFSLQNRELMHFRINSSRLVFIRYLANNIMGDKWGEIYPIRVQKSQM